MTATSTRPLAARARPALLLWLLVPATGEMPEWSNGRPVGRCRGMTAESRMIGALPRGGGGGGGGAGGGASFPSDLHSSGTFPAPLSSSSVDESDGISAASPSTVEEPPPPSVETAAAVPSSSNGGGLTKSFRSAKERLPPAMIMLGSTYLLIKYLGEKGIVGLVFLIQIGMYHETCSIVEEYHVSVFDEPPSTPLDLFERWWWFLTVATGTSLRAAVKKVAHVREGTVDLIAYGMAVVGLLGAVVGMATHADAGQSAFRSYLGNVAACHFALAFLVGQSTFWIKTVHQYGILWVLYPALLVVVNDTMAYVFGIALGKNQLLPRLSPKKTVEGFVGAGLSTVAVSSPLLKFMAKKAGSELGNVGRHALVIATFVSLVSPFGGFLASAVKRAHNAKDFGTLIPGHGGVVDRFDCQVVTAPFVYLYLKEFL